MQLSRIRLIALLTVFSTVASTISYSFAAKAVLKPLSAQRTTASRIIVALQSEPRIQEARQLKQRGDEQLNRQEFQAAIKSYRQAAQIYQELNRSVDLSLVIKSLGKAYLLGENYSQAIALFEQLAEQEKLPGYANDTALSNLGLALYRAGQLPKAEQVLRQAIAGWELLRAKETDELNKITLFEQHAHTYRLLQKVLIKQNKIAQALLVAESSRARSLVEKFVENSGSSSPPLVNLDQIKQIAKTANSTLVEYSVVGNEVRVIGNEPSDETDLLIWIVQPNGNVSFRQVDLRQLSHQSLTPLTQLVYKTRQEGIGVRGRGLSVIATSNQDSNRLTESITKAELQQLHQLLIQPIADLLPTDANDHVTLIPQGALFLVPFAALPDSQGKYLIEQHTLLSIPSIQVLALTQQQRQQLTSFKGTKSALVVGNPIMPSIPAQGNKPPQLLPSLPGAEKEALAVASLLNTQALTGNRATKIAVWRAMPQQRIIHLATHGLLDLDANLANVNDLGVPLDPNAPTATQSNVIVTPGAVIVGRNVFVGGVAAEVSLANEKVVRVSMPGAIALAASQGDNGFLTAKEILGLKLNNTELVVLSACDTGRGRIAGEGVVGLSRAFIRAGVPSVIVSLWVVPDAPTASLMSDFYRQLQQTSDKAQALREAMLITKAKFPHPRDWAAFILIGEP